MNANVYTISLPEDVQIAAVENLKPLLLAALASAAEISVNCAQVRRVDSAGVQLLLASASALAKAGRHLHMQDVTAEMRACLRVLGAETLLLTP